jgi:hypothetical protein
MTLKWLWLLQSFDGLPEEKALELVMDVDVGGGGGKGETLVYSLLLICIIYFEEMVSIVEFKEIQKRGRRETCVQSFLLGYENLFFIWG